MPRAHDGEKSKYIAGIFDSVQLVLTGTPNLVHIQAAPNITLSKVHVQALVHNGGTDSSTPVKFIVKEKRSGTVVGTVTIPDVHVPSATDQTVDAEIPIPHCHLWSPEDPFLYRLEVATSADNIACAFGMREFHFDPASGHAFLNGKPYFMRGSNTTVYRFFEDSGRGIFHGMSIGSGVCIAASRIFTGTAFATASGSLPNSGTTSPMRRAFCSRMNSRFGVSINTSPPVSWPRNTPRTCGRRGIIRAS